MSALKSLVGLVFKEIFRKKDFYVALILIGVIIAYVGQLKVYNIENMDRYVREISLSLIFFFTAFLAVPLTARQIPQEKEMRTLGVLLAKPISRFQYVAGKFLGSYLASVCAFLIFYLLFIILRWGSAKSMESVCLLQTALLFVFGLMILVAFSSALSQWLTVGANVTMSLVFYGLMLFYGDRLDLLAEKAGGAGLVAGKALYYALPHFEFFDMRQRLIHDWNPLPWSLVAFLGVYALLYSLAFLTLGYSKFRRAYL